MAAKVTQASVSYHRATKELARRCGNRVMFRPADSCILVAGSIETGNPISPNGLCNRFVAKPDAR